MLEPKYLTGCAIEIGLSEHLRQSASAWRIRSVAVHGPHYSLADLAELDACLEAHLGGLRTARRAGWRICEEELAWEDPGEIFTAAVLAFETSIPARIARVIGALFRKPELIDGVISALGWLPLEEAKSHIEELWQSPSPLLQRIAIGGAVVHRITSSDLPVRFRRAEDLALQAGALKAIGELGRIDSLSAAQPGLTSADSSVRFAASWSIALLKGDKQALQVLSSIVEAPGTFREKAMQLLVRRLDLASAKAWQSRLGREVATRRLAIQAAGAIGDPEALPWLIEQMKTPELARVAGEAFTTITGVGIALSDLEGPKPRGFEAGSTETEDENAEMDPDDTLAWPNPAFVEAQWRKNAGQFQKGIRYLCGKPMTVEWLKQVLRDGYQRQRAAAALELAIRQPGTPLFNVKARGFRQQKMLGENPSY